NRDRLSAVCVFPFRRPPRRAACRGGDLLSPAPESRVRAAVTPKTFALFVLFAPSRFSEPSAACLSASARFAFLRVFALPRARCSLRRGGDLLSPAPESRVRAAVTPKTFALFVLFAPSRFSELSAACLSASARFAFLRVFALPRARCQLRRRGHL